MEVVLISLCKRKRQRHSRIYKIILMLCTENEVTLNYCLSNPPKRLTQAHAN